MAKSAASADGKFGPAPWRAAFDEHIGSMKAPELVFTTLEPTPTTEQPLGGLVPSQNKNVPAYLPRARYCIYRGSWANLPPNQRNTAEPNPRIFDSDLPTITTDRRMGKAGQLIASGPLGSGVVDDMARRCDSGGGGPFEAVWWPTEPQTQWRLKGQAWVVGPDIDDDSRPGVQAVKRALAPHMRSSQEKTSQTSNTKWSWSRELTSQFGNLSPSMRGSFKHPAPGSRRPTDTPDTQKELDIKVESNDDPAARANFRVIVMVPTQVERLGVADQTQRRWQLKRSQGASEETAPQWEEEELWP